MNLQNEGSWLKAFQDHPDLEPRPAFVQRLEQQLIKQTVQQRLRQKLVRWVVLSGGLCAVVLLTVAILSEFQSIGKVGRGTARSAQQQALSQQIQYIQSHLAPGEQFVGTDEKNSFLFIEHRQQVVVMTNGVRKTLFTAPNDGSEVQVYSQDLPNLAIRVVKQGLSDALYLGNLNETSLQQVDLGGLSVQEVVKDPTDKSKMVALLRNSQTKQLSVQTIDLHSGKRVTLFSREQNSFANLYECSHGMVFASPYEITVFAGNQLHTLFRSEQPQFAVVDVSGEGILFTQGALPDVGNQSFDHGSSQVMFYDWKTQQANALLPGVMGSQQWVPIAGQPSPVQLIGNFVALPTTGRSEQDLHEQLGLLQIYAVQPNRSPKLIDQESTTWYQRLLSAQSQNGQYLIARQSEESQSRSQPFLSYDWQSGKVSKLK